MYLNARKMLSRLISKGTRRVSSESGQS